MPTGRTATGRRPYGNWRTESLREAQAEHLAHREAALRSLDRIRAILEGPQPVESIHWGHVGDMAETDRQLQQVIDRLAGEGEWAL